MGIERLHFVQISIDRLEEEGRKIRGHTPLHHLQPVVEADETLADRVIRRILRPNITPMKMERDFNPNGQFCLSWEDVSQLCLMTLEIVKSEPMVAQLRAPMKGNGWG